MSLFAQEPKASVAVLNLDELTWLPTSFLVRGEAKKGKTHFALSILPWLEKQGKKPEECMVLAIDCDGGLPRLAKAGRVKQEWKKAIKYVRATTFKEVEEVTEMFLPLLRAHMAKFGGETAWVIVDNMGTVWEWVRDQYAIDTYGMMEHELAKEVHKKALEQGKKTLPTFDPRSEYGIMNGTHGAWLTSIQMSGVNYILLAPEVSWTEREGGESNIKQKSAGHKFNEHKVEHILRVYTEGDDHYMDLLGSWTAPGVFRRRKECTFESFLAALEILRKRAEQPKVPDKLE